MENVVVRDNYQIEWEWHGYTLVCRLNVGVEIKYDQDWVFGGSC